MSRPGCRSLAPDVTCPDSCESERLGAGPCPSTPGLPDPALIVGQWRDPAPGIAQANAAEREMMSLRPGQMWQIPDDTSLEDAYALLHAAAVRIWRECLELRERWANNTEPAHAGAAIPRAVAYQYVAGQIGRAIEGARALHPPKGHP